jgi:ribonucleoside-diphosphate reductase alpha chain
MNNNTTNTTQFGPIGEDVYRRTYSRLIDGRHEDWTDTVRRVVGGNVALDPHVSPHERMEMVSLMERFAFLPAGRHLWVTGVDGIVGEARRNCFRAPFTKRLADHFEFLGSMLLLGGGVGANYSHEYLSRAGEVHPFSLSITCSPDHKDYEQVRAAGAEFFTHLGGGLLVDDSREGWVGAWGSLFDAATSPLETAVVLDVSKVRPHGDPILTFGGTASGPSPLVSAIVGIYRVLTGAVGRTLSGIEAMHCDHAIASAVVAGGARRSARMSIMHWRDPDIMEFVHCKENYIDHWTTNISVEVDGAFFEALSVGDDHARMVLDQVVVGMHRNGEPGFYNSALSAVGEHGDVRSTNPCLAGDSWVQTSDGLRQIDDLVGKGVVDLVIDGKVWKSSDLGFFETGVKPTLKINVDGTTTSMTHDHPVLTPSGWVLAGDLSVGSDVVLTTERDARWSGRGSEAEGYLLGTLVGDGTFSDRAHLDVWPDDFSVIPTIMGAVEDAGLVHRSDWTGFRTTSEGKQRLTSAALRDLAASYGIKRGTKTVTSEIMAGSSDLFIGFLRGLFDTDGHVEGSSTESGVTVRLTQSDRDALGLVRVMLLALGIRSVVRSSHPAGRKGGLNGQVNPSRASYRLIVSGSDVAKFAALIGFANERKSTLLNERLSEMSRGAYSKPNTGKVVSITEGETVPVYDVQVPGLNAFVANGNVVHNCGEVPLEMGESCNIGSVDIGLFGRDDEGALNAFRLMTRFLIRQTLTAIRTEPTATVEARNRRIGVGFLGLQEWAAAHGVRYSDIASNGELRAKMRKFREVCRQEADRYCTELGIPRCIKVTAIAPNGTIAQLRGTQPGAHAILARWYIRNVRYTTGDPRIEKARADGLHVEPCVYAENTWVVSYPVADPLVERFSAEIVQQIDEVSIAEQFAVLAAVTAEFTGGNDGNAVSFTASFDPESVTADELMDAVRAWLPHVKGMTVFPTMSRPQSPYVPLTEDDYRRFKSEMHGDVFGDTGDEDIACSVGGACPIR